MSDVPLVTVDIPYAGDDAPEGSALPGYFYRAVGDGPKPLIVMWNGLDSTKEMMYTSGFPQQLAARGISTLMVDPPGSGEALRMRDLHARYDTEVWAASILDWIEQQAAVAREVDRNLMNIRDLAHQTSTGANQTSAASQELSRLAVDLNSMVARFSV